MIIRNLDVLIENPFAKLISGAASNKWAKGAMKWLGVTAAFEVTVEGLTSLFEVWAKQNFKPDPRAIPDRTQARFEDAKGNPRWMTYDQTSGKWYDPTGAKFDIPKGTSPDEFWRKGFKSAVDNNKIDFKNITEYEYKKSVAYADAHNKFKPDASGNMPNDKIDKMYEKYVNSKDVSRSDRKKWNGAAKILASRVTGFTVIMGSALYYWHTAYVIRLALDDKLEKNEISRPEYDAQLKLLRAGYTATIVSVATGMFITGFVTRLFLYGAQLSTLLSKSVKVHKASKIAATVTGASIGVFIGTSEEGKKLLLNTLVDIGVGPGIAGGVDWVQEKLYNLGAGILDLVWANEATYELSAANAGVADKEMQAGNDIPKAVQQSIPKVNKTPDNITPGMADWAKKWGLN